MANSTKRKLTIKFDGDETGLAQASKSASASLENFDKSTEKSASRIDRAGEASEGLADSSSLATGALGALGSGLELVGLDGYAQRLQQAALATDFMSGVGDSLTLVTKKLGLATAATKAKTLALTIATKARTAATKAATIAQKAANLAMRMNPIGLVITAILGLVAVFITCYKKSETFRRIVNKVFHAVQKVVSSVWHWIKRHWPLLLEILTGPIGLAVRVITKHWDSIKSGVSRVKDWIVHKFNQVVGFVRGLPGRIGRAAGGMWNGIKNSFRGAINSVIGWWNGLHFTLPSVSVFGHKIGGFTLSTPNIGYLASGGLALAGHSYIVGEKGPELLTMGPQSGHVTPNDRLAGTLADVNVRVFIGDTELRGMVRTEISESNRDTRRRAGMIGGVAWS